MQNSHEAILSALLTLLTNSVVVPFTAASTAASPVLTGVSSVANMFLGLPIFGPGVVRGASILSIDSPTQITLTDNVGVTNPGGTSFKTGFLKTGRRVHLWEEVKGEMPCLFLRHVSTQDDYVQTVLQKTSIDAEVWIYSKAGQNPNFAPDTQLNNLSTAVRNALAPDVRGYPQTLASVNGGSPMVAWARVEGKSEYDPGDLDDFAKALIPIRILCP